MNNHTGHNFVTPENCERAARMSNPEDYPEISKSDKHTDSSELEEVIETKRIGQTILSSPMNEEAIRGSMLFFARKLVLVPLRVLRFYEPSVEGFFAGLALHEELIPDFIAMFNQVVNGRAANRQESLPYLYSLLNSSAETHEDDRKLQDEYERTKIRLHVAPNELLW